MNYASGWGRPSLGGSPWSGGGGAAQEYWSEMMARGIVDYPPDGTYPNTFVGSTANWYFNEFGKIEVTETAQAQDFGDAIPQRWYKLQTSPGSFVFNEWILKFSGVLATPPSGTAYVNRWSGARSSDAFAWSAMQQVLTFGASSLQGWPGDLTSIADVRTLEFNVPARGSNSYSDGGGMSVNGDCRFVLGSVQVPLGSGAPHEFNDPHLGIAFDTTGATNESGNAALLDNDGVGWYSKLRVAGGGSAQQAGFLSNEWIEATFESALSRWVMRTRTLEVTNDGYQRDLSVVFTCDGALTGEGPSASRWWRTYGYLVAAGPTFVESEIGNIEWDLDEPTEATAHSSIKMHALDGGSLVEVADFQASLAAFPGSVVREGNVQLAPYGFSVEIDLTAAAATYEVLPPKGFRYSRNATVFQIVQKDGTVTVAPTFSAGTNAPNYDNYHQSQTPAGFTTQAAQTVVGVASVAASPTDDLTSNGFRVNITNPATLGTATVLTGRMVTLGTFLPV